MTSVWKFLQLCALIAATTPACPLFAQEVKPERETVTGSYIPRAVEYEPLAAEQARRSSARFATCVYKRDPELVIKLLDNSDPVDIDFTGAGLTGSNFSRKLGLETCLGKEALTDKIQLRIKPGVLHEMLTEPAYLAANPEPPAWLSRPFTSTKRRFVTIGPKLPLAQGLAEIADCMVKAAPAQSDALLRTRVTSDEERAAAAALAPALGGCLYEGQTLELTPRNIRGWAALGLWQAERSRMATVDRAN